jgi:hypothetical protein
MDNLTHAYWYKIITQAIIKFNTSVNMAKLLNKIFSIISWKVIIL